MQQQLLYVRALQRASELKGGEERLAHSLGVRVDDVRNWQSGGAPVPTNVFLKVADILADHAVSQISHGDAQN